jgi:spore maturation protein SpmA
MVSDKLSFFSRMATGIVVGSVLAATWFHLSVIAVSSDWLISRQHGVEQRISEVLIKHASLIVFQSMFVLIIFLCLGLPIFFVARRMGMANLFTAITSGFIVGLLVSILYGGPDFDSLLGFVKMMLIFGVSGVIAAYALWYAVRH